MEGTGIQLPGAPGEQAGRDVRCWTAPVVLPTYRPQPPDRYPAFFERRVYQGSSGRVYPLPFYDRIAEEPVAAPWQAVHLENRWLRLMVLPELGGRLHLARDLTTGYDLIYRNDVIKPALVGLAGPWISGGIELNWPQHHRPATFLPTSVDIEWEDDGAVTVWCSDHDPFQRMRASHGFRLRPDTAQIELRARLQNRTPLTQTFLWWANVAVEVHDDYQSFFPTDVEFVADHARRAVTAFPAADRAYYGVDYPGLVDADHPDANRIDWWKHIPVPTSYMCLGTDDDFFGGYDHRAGVGLVHWADHHISPGKKQWTWGNAPFGEAWNRNLTDHNGPYIELMAGVFTDNQPDFSFLAPGEVREFSQWWYPVHGTGPVHQATREAAAHLSAEDGTATVAVAVAVTRPRPATSVELRRGDETLWSTVADLAPGTPLSTRVPLTGGGELAALTLVVSQAGRELVRYRPRPELDRRPEPEPATEPRPPVDTGTVEELYLAGLHLAQYRHATRRPEPYWEEGLRRDPGHVGCHLRLAEGLLRRGLPAAAETHLRAAVERLTTHNPNPADGEPWYLLGLAMAAQGRDADATVAFGKALWNQAWIGPARVGLARLATRACDFEEAGRHAEAAHLARPSSDTAALRLAVARAAGRPVDGEIRATRQDDPGNAWLAVLAGDDAHLDPQRLLDVAFEYRALGLWERAAALFGAAAERQALRPVEGMASATPMAQFGMAAALHRLGHTDGAMQALAGAAAADRTWAFPERLEELAVLDEILDLEPADPVSAPPGTFKSVARALRGTWLYTHRRPHEAIDDWRAALAAGAVIDPVTLRNLAVATVNVDRDLETATGLYEQALELAPGDTRLWFEADQLAALRGAPPLDRLARLERAPHAVARRDDLGVARAFLLAGEGRLTEAEQFLHDRRFQPWEGGEGRVLQVFDDTQLGLALTELDTDPAAAVRRLEQALVPPENLGEARHPLANVAQLHQALGDARQLAADGAGAQAAWTVAAGFRGDFRDMDTTPYSEESAAGIVALRRLGRHDEAAARLDGFRRYLDADRDRTATIDYFATSLPDLLLFDRDLQQLADRRRWYLEAQYTLLRDDPQTAGEWLDRLLDADPAHPGIGRLGWITAEPGVRPRTFGHRPSPSPRTPTHSEQPGKGHT